MKQNKSTIKTYFETGDKPTQEEYGNLIDSYVDSQQEAGEANRRFVINADGEVVVSSEQKLPEYNISDIDNNKIYFLKDGAVVKEIDLTNYIDDTNLSRLVSGSVDSKGVATFRRDDDSVFTVDFAGLIKPVDVPEIQAGENVTIDKTDPLNPIINSSSKIEGIESTGTLADGNNEVVIGDKARGGYASFSYTNGNLMYGDNKFVGGVKVVTGSDFIFDEILYSVNGYNGENPTVTHAAHLADTMIFRKTGFSNGRYIFEHDFFNGLKIRKGITAPNTYVDAVIKSDQLTQNQEYQLPNKSITFAGVDDIPKVKAGKNITIDETDPLNPVISASSGTPGLQTVLENSNEATTGFILKDTAENTQFENTPDTLSIKKTTEASDDPDILGLDRNRESALSDGKRTKVEESKLTKDSLVLSNTHGGISGSPIKNEFSIERGLVVQSGVMGGVSEIRIGPDVNVVSFQGVSKASLNEYQLRIGELSGSRTIVDRNGITSVNGIGNNFQIMPPQTGWDSSYQARFQPKSHTIAGLDDIPKIQGGRNVTIDDTDPLNPVINVDSSGATNTVTTDTKQTISGEKTITSNLFTSYIQSDNSINIARNITAGGRIRTGGNALDFTESGNAGSATIQADIIGSTIHTLQPKSGTIAHVNDIPNLKAGTNISIDNTDPSNPIINSNSAGLPNNFTESGSWTPVLVDTNGDGTYSHNVSQNMFSRVGNMVTVSARISSINTSGNPTGYLRIEGLPFKAAIPTVGLIGTISTSNLTREQISQLSLQTAGNANFATFGGIDIVNIAFSQGIKFTGVGVITFSMTYITNEF
ncbi:hypothetical protein [Tenacibaculum sp. 190524A05c]|uniref:hypothetical protein n=1 Tax=Tenacibaculum platacis TaxID=3137852 RepID=UPI0032B10769